MSPTALPKKGTAPVGLTLEGSMKSTDRGTRVSALETVALEFDKAGVLNTKGLASCKVGQLEATTTKTAEKVCGDAVVGQGHVTADITLPEQAPSPRQRPAADLQRLQGRQAGTDPARLRARPGGDDLRRPGEDQQGPRQVRHQSVHPGAENRQRQRLGDELQSHRSRKSTPRAARSRACSTPVARRAASRSIGDFVYHDGTKLRAKSPRPARRRAEQAVAESALSARVPPLQRGRGAGLLLIVERAPASRTAAERVSMS